VKIAKWTYALTIFGLVLISTLAVIFIMVPMSYPLLTHYERLAEIILHTLNKLPKPLVEIEVVACSQLYEYVANKSASE
jgi:sensor histidine kinase YesM